MPAQLVGDPVGHRLVHHPRPATGRPARSSAPGSAPPARRAAPSAACRSRRPRQTRQSPRGQQLDGLPRVRVQADHREVLGHLLSVHTCTIRRPAEHATSQTVTGTVCCRAASRRLRDRRPARTPVEGGHCRPDFPALRAQASPISGRRRKRPRKTAASQLMPSATNCYHSSVGSAEGSRPREDWMKWRRPGRVVVAGFALATVVGTILLMLPVVVRER